MNSKKRAIVLGLAWITITTPIWYAIWQQDVQVADENHAIESLQIILLVLAVLLFAWRSRQTQQEMKGRRLMFVAIALLQLSYAFRELELRKLAIPDVIKAIDPVGTAIVAAMWVAFIFLAWPHFKSLVTEALSAFTTPFGVLLTMGGVLYLCSWPFDRLHWAFGPLKTVFIEELIEFQAAGLFALAGIVVPTGISTGDVGQLATSRQDSDAERTNDTL